MADLAVAGPSEGQTDPDIMNDPRFATNTEANEDGDVDTCRICRGEGSGTEPLFHPCKCSGSIKYVHQDCLMEWLSHSHKKHCELCKTPFRFTKLYSANMPQSLPFPILARHVMIHTVKNVATWLRFVMVVVVWLVALPYALRQLWRLLFWFSDGGLPPYPSRREPFQGGNVSKILENAGEILEVGQQFYQMLKENGTSPTTPLQPTQTNSALIGVFVEKLIALLMPVSRTLNLSGSDPLAAGIRSLYYGFGLHGAVDEAGNNITTSNYDTTSSEAIPNLSILSEVSFLRNLTRNAFLNQVVITVVEGYTITILVVVCFILVFLIREWVVQQQPGINVGAGFDPDVDRPRGQHALPRGQQPLPEFRHPRNAEGRQGQGAQIIENGILNVVDRPDRAIARPRRRNVHFGEDIIHPPAPNDLDPDGVRPRPSTPSSNVAPPENAGNASNSRPSPREAFSPALEIRRRLTEEPRMTEEFLAIWRRADSNPQEVLRIIESENKSAEMGYWVRAMKMLDSPDSKIDNDILFHPTDPDSSGSVKNQPEFALLGPRRYSPAAGGLAFESDGSSASSESWVDVPKSIDATESETSATFHDPRNPAHEHGNHRFLNKGKQREDEPSPQPSGSSSRQNHSDKNPSKGGSQQGTDTKQNTEPRAVVLARPRAKSDGPQRNDNISFLANNNWTFSGVAADHAANKEDHEVPKSNNAGFDNGLNSRESSPSRLLPSAQGESSVNPGSNSQMATAEMRKMEQNQIEITSEDGSVCTYANVEEAFAANPVGLEIEGGPQRAEAMVDDQALGQEPPIAPRIAEAVGIFENIVDFLWGGFGEDRQDEQAGNDERIVQDLAAEAPFVPVPGREIVDEVAREHDREDMEAALAAGIDPMDLDAIDDGEDFEGIMDLVGMRGPLLGLIQNALFSTLLLALAVAIGVWIPYNIGRVILLLVANPASTLKLPLRLIFGIAAFLQDLTLSILGAAYYIGLSLFSILSYIWSPFTSPDWDLHVGIRESRVGVTAAKVSGDAMGRIMNGTIDSLIHIADSDIFAFSAASHEALNKIEACFIHKVSGIGATVIYIFTGDWRFTFSGVFGLPLSCLSFCRDFMVSLRILLMKPDTWVISLGVVERATPLDLGLSIWGGWARFWAIFTGYTTLYILGALYVRRSSPFSVSAVGRAWEIVILDILNQAGGVMKVILIISIEMLVFPLYCGLLLDVALLPLFDHATIISRINFTAESPFTSIFVHWFVGTCYMFHFALFVSMCRKIMRKGVLYFIRDPDDPTFHPVRDVLERNVATQLRKILFSALVYGALVVICLGGVVWGLAFVFKNVLPIHWSSNEPVLEFPVDLLFYNFLMPLAVRVFKPSDGLHAMYSWWFRQCARMLRLTWFMFDERKLDEEGYHVRKTWRDILLGSGGDPAIPEKADRKDGPFTENPELKAYFCRDGKYVRAPASDQVRIPKGGNIFLEVDALNDRVDKACDHPDGIHGFKNPHYKQVYIPPLFQLRISLFILSIWLFAACTGVGITIVPLVFGRYIFAKIIPPHVHKNDVYAFSIGIYVLGSALYIVLHLRQFVSWLGTVLEIDAETPQNVLHRVARISSRLARIAWTYVAFLVILPTLGAMVVEFYLIVPLHTYFSVEERHVVHFVQSWTLGLLYVKLATCVILWHGDSRPAQSLRAVIRNGYLDPDARVATRSFIVPGFLLLSSALLFPWGIAKLAIQTVLKNSPEHRMSIYRYAYPICLAICVQALALWRIFKILKHWRMMIRDEVYLIGERLHNFGDRKVASPSVNANVPSVRRLNT
ncbi:hypothetical protein BJ875DRAFT_210336 [Amylocarpus encephaloides]|uniref:RING-type E3 ubiquitin transferase n=1 Tax=Amylocarpus encephaloides TaxID=45428 RepID=A0A9P8C7X0_9HELO|nr:hypothetical protein BJ875DRAFT_210336 [Amylocarpus encephaloides]